jgi:hypothetical protein
LAALREGVSGLRASGLHLLGVWCAAAMSFLARSWFSVREADFFGVRGRCAGRVTGAHQSGV